MPQRINDTDTIAGIILIIVIVLLIRSWKKRKLKIENIEERPYQSENAASRINYADRYEAISLLTRNEWYEYKKLQKLIENTELQICPKVRLMDIITPHRGTRDYKTLQYKIQAKHVDFVICDKDLRIKAILEIDDNSHKQEDRKLRDEFVDQILTSVGYKVIRTYAITEEVVKKLTENDDPAMELSSNAPQIP